MTDRSVGMHNARDGIASVDIHITYHKMLVVKIGIFFVVRAFREAKRSIQRVIFCRVAYVTSLIGICFDGMGLTSFFRQWELEEEGLRDGQ